MPARVTVLVGTRKGCFLLESDADRRDWSVRGPYCDGWPIYHAIHDAATGALYAAAASEWHGAGVWRSADGGENWTMSSEGLSYENGDLKLSKVSGLTAAHGRLLAGAESAGVFESRDEGATWSLLSTLDGQPGRDEWNDPANQPPGHLGMPATLPHPDDPARFWAIVQGFGIFETTDDGGSWTPRNRGLRADWPLENPEVGYCVHKLVMSPVETDRFYQQNHVGMHRSDDAGQTWVEITEGLPTEFGFAAAAHPHDRDTFYVVPLDPGHGRCMPDGRGGRVAHAGRGLDVAAPRPGAAPARRAPRRPARGHGDRLPRRARPLLRDEHRPGVRERRRGRDMERDRQLPAGDLVGRGRGHELMADIHLPPTLPSLYADLPRRLEIDAGTVDEVIDRLEERWPGLRDRLCEPGPALRTHINVYVDRERAGLDTALGPGSRVDVIAAISGG